MGGDDSCVTRVASVLVGGFGMGAIAGAIELGWKNTPMKKHGHVEGVGAMMSVIRNRAGLLSAVGTSYVATQCFVDTLVERDCSWQGTAAGSGSMGAVIALARGSIYQGTSFAILSSFAMFAYNYNGKIMNDKEEIYRRNNPGMSKSNH